MAWFFLGDWGAFAALLRQQVTFWGICVCVSNRMASSAVSDLTRHLVNPITYVQRCCLSHWIFPARLLKLVIFSTHWFLHILQKRERNTGIFLLQNVWYICTKATLGWEEYGTIVIIGHSLCYFSPFGVINVKLNRSCCDYEQSEKIWVDKTKPESLMYMETISFKVGQT